MPGNPGHVSSACVVKNKEDETKKLIKCAMTKLRLASSRLIKIIIIIDNYLVLVMLVMLTLILSVGC